MTTTDIGIYRGLKSKFNPSVHVGFFITTDTSELLIGDLSLGQAITGYEIEDGVLTLKFNTGKTLDITIPEATAEKKGLLSAEDYKKLASLQTELDKKVDKEEGKSLIKDELISKLEELPSNEDLESKIGEAKTAAEDAQKDIDDHKKDKENPHEVTKEQVGLGNVTNDVQVKRSEMGVADGVATLDGEGLVPAGQLPIDKETIIEDGGVIKVAPEALTQYVGKEAISVTGDTTTKTIALVLSSLNKILSQSNDGLLATLKFKDDEANKKIQLLGVNDAVVTEFDYAKFVVDGMINTIELKGDILTFTFNTDAGKEAIPIDLSKYITIYTAGNGIDIEGQSISIKIKEGESYLEVGEDGLASKDLDETFAKIEETTVIKDTDGTVIKEFQVTQEAEFEDVIYTRSQTDAKFAQKAEIVDMATQTWVKDQHYLTEHQSLEGLATKEDVDKSISSLNSAISYKADRVKTEGKLEELDRAIKAIDVNGDIQKAIEALDLPNTYETIENVKSLIATAKSEILGGAGTDYDTLKEIETWITDHQDLYQALVNGLATKATTEYVDGELDKKADKQTTYTKSEVDTELEKKADKTTLDNYYTKGEVDKAIEDVDVSDQLVDYAKIAETTAVKQGDKVITDLEIVEDTPEGDLVYTKKQCDERFYTKAEVDALINQLRQELSK